MKPEIEKPRGILLRKAGEKRFQLTRLQPSRDLNCFVERYWIVSWDLRDQPPYVQETLPYPCVNLVVEKDRSMIYGVQTGKFARLLEGHGRVFGVKFKPGAFYPFCKVPISQITNTCKSFQSTLGVDSKALEKALLAHEAEGVMKEIGEDFLASTRLPNDWPRTRAETVQRWPRISAISTRRTSSKTSKPLSAKHQLNMRRITKIERFQ